MGVRLGNLLLLLLRDVKSTSLLLLLVHVWLLGLVWRWHQAIRRILAGRGRGIRQTTSTVWGTIGQTTVGYRVRVRPSDRRVVLIVGLLICLDDYVVIIRHGWLLLLLTGTTSNVV